MPRPLTPQEEYELEREAEEARWEFLWYDTDHARTRYDRNYPEGSTYIPTNPTFEEFLNLTPPPRKRRRRR